MSEKVREVRDKVESSLKIDADMVKQIISIVSKLIPSREREIINDIAVCMLEEDCTKLRECIKSVLRFYISELRSTPGA